MSHSHQFWMQCALNLAKQAGQQGEVPVGAVLVREDKIIGEGQNQQIGKNDPSAHAEIQALRAAAHKVDNYRLPDTRLYVTLEPCAMCAGAIIHARIAEVIIAAMEPRAGAAGSVLNILDHSAFNHQCRITQGVCADESSNLLKAFFQARR